MHIMLKNITKYVRAYMYRKHAQAHAPMSLQYLIDYIYSTIIIYLRISHTCTFL